MGEIQGVTESIHKYSRRGKREARAARKKGMVETMELYVAISKKKSWLQAVSSKLLEMKQMKDGTTHLRATSKDREESRISR